MYERERDKMVKEQIAARGVKDERVLDAMRRVPRERFVLTKFEEMAYSDRPLPIEDDQTISQPYIVALMVQAMQLNPQARVLEVGTGSGYAAAVISKLAKEVFTIERHAGLARAAADRLSELDYDNVRVRHGDGTLGWPEAAPFDAVVVAAAGAEVPEALKEQLKLGGRLVIPVGDSQIQSLLIITRVGENDFDVQKSIDVRFVPLIASKA
ncbi:MAG: protein-L-isoaspartate(D-aspartate) O-methyltransferase [Candidatus Eremiobacteraeota bacterium]|nr:protein-L-isoaspartate(D-aspartate) O-methyltransferase [Candidatus Eremiobacteraeota bacterium]